ncbi:MAG: glutathione synthase [Candidatus Marinimicrobia bacterium]|nr:glutathione synthase [Candidatus Neomarinimicrobiota bacterium]
MSLSVAIQMDPMDSIDINGDSTFVLALEAQKRGYSLYHYLPSHLTLNDGRVTARAYPLTVQRKMGRHFDLGPMEALNLHEMDAVLMRQDPPFNMAYITATHILEHIHPETLVVNDPFHVRNAPEKLFVTHFENVMPPTLISADIDEVRAFRQEHKDIIVKPVYGNGGAGVFHLPPGDENLGALIELFTTTWCEPIMVQRYIPEVRKGDKRVILIEGRPVGAINRVPAVGEARSNMHVGGRPEKATLTGRELEICEVIGPTLAKNGIIFAGIDVIGGYLTEINVTSPTGLQEVNRFDGVALESQIWDAIEARLP